MQVKQNLEHKFPHLEVVGTNYPPGKTKLAFASMTQLATLGTIGMTLTGEQLFRTLGYPIPPWQTYLGNNKMSTCMTSWLLGNTVAQNLVSTGAFEVYYDGNLVFSKLTTGKLPVVRDILNDVEAALAAAGRLQGDPNATSLPHSDDTIHDLF